MMIPDHKKLVSRYASEPFALIGINSDGEGRSALKKKFKKHGVTWRQVLEGAEMPLSSAWNVRAFTTICDICADPMSEVSISTWPATWSVSPTTCVGSPRSSSSSSNVTVLWSESMT